MKKHYILLFILILSFIQSNAQESVARMWNELQLQAIREDRVRVPVQARNLFHTAIAMYDCWALYDDTATPFLMGHSYAGVSYPLGPIAAVTDSLAAQKEAMSYAAYRVLKHRYSVSPNWVFAHYRFDTLMAFLGYDPNYTSTNYATGTPADLGNYIGQKIIDMGYTDSSNEINAHVNINYLPSNTYLEVDSSGNPNMVSPNHWQPLFIVGALDQSGNPLTSGQIFDAPEWGRVTPFALQASDRTDYFKNGGRFPVYYDPGPPPTLDTVNATDSSSALYKWGHTMVATWSSHLDPDDTTMWDISPAGLGNVPLSYLPIGQQGSYYRYLEGGDTGRGYSLNPVTFLPYTSQLIKRGDYTRVVSQYWADGPHSETPPGHWYTFFNYVSDHPLTLKKIKGLGPVVTDLEWDVKGYFALGGALHDAAISAWGIKGWYDSPRPISAIRKMALYGQSSNPALPAYHPGGITLTPGYIELIDSTDSLVGPNYEHLNEIKLRAWRGFDSINDPWVDYAGVGWIYAADWMPYQRNTFVSPPFAGYVSGHSTFSRAGAEFLTNFTGSPYFPGGLGQFQVNANSNFLFFENGPSTNLTLQWASYADASNEASLSRIWGGIHPPFDDMYGRVNGKTIGINALNYAENYFNATALPIHLASFDAMVEKCKVSLHWKTLSEENSSFFELWHSEDGVHFNTKIANLTAAGNSSRELNYSFIHFPESKHNYYKLVERSIDGEVSTVAFSQRVSLDCNTKESIVLAVIPNPSISEFTLILKDKSDFIEEIQMVDITGKTIMHNNLNKVGLQQEVFLQWGHIPDGNYLLTIKTLNGQSLSKLITKQSTQ